MSGLHGGQRPGSGRKPKDDTTSTTTPKKYADALSYLAAVVRGDEPADGLRIAAAKACLPYQEPKRAAPVESPAPQTLRRKTTASAAAADAAAWEEKAAAVRARHGRA